MTTRLVVSRAYRLTHQLRYCSSWSLDTAATLRRLHDARLTIFSNAEYISPLLERCSPIIHQQRSLTYRNRTSGSGETQGDMHKPITEPELSQKSGASFAQKSKDKVRDKVQRQRKSLQRALARFKSRLELFKIYMRYRERRKLFSNLTSIKRYMSEKKLKFGAITKNPERIRKLREIKEKIAKKSAAFRLIAAFAIKKYGKLGAGIYLGVYVVTLVLMNLLTFNGYLSADDLRRMLDKLHMNHFNIPDIDSGVARFTVAYLATKALEPLRFIVSLLMIMAVNRALKR